MSEQNTVEPFVTESCTLHNVTETISVPYIVHEGVTARMERTTRRLWIMCLVLILLLVGSNVMWIWYESQFIDYVETVEQDVESFDGENLIMNGTGEVSVGVNVSASDDYNKAPRPQDRR